MHLVEHIDDLSESRGVLSLNDGIHNDLTNASLDNRDNSLLDEINTNGSESDRSTHRGQPIQGINDVPMPHVATNNANRNEEEWQDLF